MVKKPNKQTDAPLVRAAMDLQASIDEIETLTSRSAKVELSSQAELARAAELLSRAEARHHEFLAHLGALAGAVDDLRARQNQSASTLSQHAQSLEERRASYDALDTRFAQLAASASAMGSALAASEPGSNGAGAIDAAKAAVGKVRERMAAAVDEARVLTLDAKEAGFTDLEKQAHAIRQQLSSLLKKIDEALAS